MKLETFLQFIEKGYVSEKTEEDLKTFDIVFRDNDSIFQINNMVLDLDKKLIMLEYKNE